MNVARKMVWQKAYKILCLGSKRAQYFHIGFIFFFFMFARVLVCCSLRLVFHYLYNKPSGFKFTLFSSSLLHLISFIMKKIENWFSLPRVSSIEYAKLIAQ